MPNVTSPNRKVGAGGLAGAVTVIAAWLVNSLTSLDPPLEVVAAFAVLVQFGTGYFIKDPPVDPAPGV